MVSVCLLVVLSLECITSAQSGKKKKVFGFSEEILPINIEEEEPTGISAEDFEARAQAKKEMLQQKTDKEDLMVQLKQKPKKVEGEVPLKRKEGAGSPQEEAAPTEEAAPKIEAPKAPEPDLVEPAEPKVVEVEVVEPELAEVEEAEIQEALTPANIAVPLGSVLLVKTGADSGVKIYEWVGKRMGGVRKDIASETLRIEVDELPEELKASIEPLLEVEGVGIEVPGTDYAVAKGSEVAPIMKYDVNDKLFTIDEITLEKKRTGEIVVHVPRGAKKDFSEKVLCLNKTKDDMGRTIRGRLESGDVEILAMVLSEWARYKRAGFKFDSESEGIVAKAVIRIVGVGVGDAVVRLETSEMSSKALEDEISRIVGDDKEAWDSIMEFIYPRAPENGFRGPYRGRRKTK